MFTYLKQETLTIDTKIGYKTNNNKIDRNQHVNL